MKRYSKVFIIILISLCCGVFHYFEIFFTWDHWLSDQLYQRSKMSDPNIKIIAIDETTLERYGPFGTWSRQYYADLLTTIEKKADPIIYGFDIFFQGNIDQQGDIAFAKEAENAGNVHVISYTNFKSKVSLESTALADMDLLHIDRIDYPYQELKVNTTQGFGDTCIDQDGYVRNAYLEMDYQGEKIPSFVYQIYQDVMKQRKQEVVRPITDQHQRYGIRYSGKHSGYEVYSFADVIDGSVDASLFDDSIIFIGAYASGMQDSYYVPSMRDGSQMYGVELQANILQSLMEQTTLHRLPPMLESFINVVLCGSLLLMLYRKSLKMQFIGSIVGCFGIFLLGKYLFSKGIIISLWYLFITFVLYLLGKIINSYLQEYQHKKHLTELFKRYVAPEIVEKIIKDDHQISLIGENRDIAILFVDIRGFTSLSESLSPEQVVDLLNRYLNMVSESIFAHSGTLDKYIGDAAMAIYNAPLDDEDPIGHAILSAMDMVNKSHKINAYAKEKYQVDLGFGIGIHYGPAIIGNIGGNQRMDYTAISDAVNTASRIEGKAKHQQILVSDTVYEQVKERFQFQNVGCYNLKGKKQQMMLYEVISNVEEGS